ncbi:hypothetical protein [Intrasporangium sp. YIM S08009]|uniref:hypothetical protein n=1 Tax=Intrasporangium zincisolvens TaxID=3080018 RepID=UPI002B05747D|nr:hypothetical protein [Intrasporangium sp. YIM S08009]
MSSEISPGSAGAVARLLERLTRYTGDEHSRYAETTLPGGDESDILDVLIQTAESTSMFALWYGEGLPKSCDDDGFAAVAQCVRAPDGSIIAWYEEVRADENDEPYERVRILVAFRPDGLVVTLNRYANAGPAEPVDPWEFASLQALALAPAWGNAAG